MKKTLALAVILTCACARQQSVEYVQMDPVKDLVEVGYEAPKTWGRHIAQAGTADNSWSIELVHPDNRLINIDIKKYSATGKHKGYPTMTPKELLEHVQGLPKTTVGAVEPFALADFKASSFNYEGDYLQFSGGGPAPKMRGIDVFFESNGFLYVINYAVPVDEFEKNRPIFDRLIKTFKLEPA